MAKEEVIQEVIHVLTVDQLDDLITQAGEYLLKNAYVTFSKKTLIALGLVGLSSYYFGARTYRSYVLWKIKQGELVVVPKTP